MKRLTETARNLLESVVEFTPSENGSGAVKLVGTLARPDYLQVNEVLEACGAKWNRKAKLHLVEPSVPSFEDKLASILETGELPTKNPLAFYPTPPDVATRVASLLWEHSSPEQRHSVILEPSIGEGHIAEAIRDLWKQNGMDAMILGIELDETRAKMASEKQKFTVFQMSFLDHITTNYELVAMNPPFAVQGDATAWATHFLHAWNMLNPGGIIVAVLPSGITFRKTKKIMAICNVLSGVEPVASGAFEGTGVNTCICWARKPENA